MGRWGSKVKSPLCVCSVVSDSSVTLLDCSPPVSSVHGISQAGILEWVAIASSRGSSWPRDRSRTSCISCIGRQILYRWATREAPGLETEALEQHCAIELSVMIEMVPFGLSKSTPMHGHTQSLSSVFTKFIYFFDHTGSSLLHETFCSCSEWRLLLLHRL